VEQPEDSDLRGGVGGESTPLSQVKPGWVDYVRDVFVSETVPAYALASGPLPVGQHMPPHAHEFLEIFVVASGSGIHRGARGSITMGPGDVIVIRPGAWHSFTVTQDLTVGAIGISPAALREDLAFLRARPLTRDLLYAGPIGGIAQGMWMAEILPAAAQETFERLRHLEKLIVERPADTLLQLGELIAVFGVLTSGMAAPEVHDPLHPAVAAVLNLIDANPERDWHATEFASAVNLDVAYLTRLFRAQVGVPPIAYLARIRAEKAAHLLTVTDLPALRVGERVGWPDSTYFARRFQALIGLTPTEYRRRMREDPHTIQTR
jgi:AraC family L-rhamnose operon transcriptional activator RhaR